MQGCKADSTQIGPALGHLEPQGLDLTFKQSLSAAAAVNVHFGGRGLSSVTELCG